MQNSRWPITPAELDILEQIEEHVTTVADDNTVTRESAVTYFIDLWFEPVDAWDQIEQLLLTASHRQGQSTSHGSL